MNKLLFIETLTTGPYKNCCAIYRIGGAFCEESENGLIEKQTFDLRMKPYEGAVVNDNSLWSSGENRNSVMQYPNQKEAFKEFTSMVMNVINIRNPKDKLFIAGFNVARFDLDFLGQWYKRNNNNDFRNCFYLQTEDLMIRATDELKWERASMPDFQMDTVARHLNVIPTKRETYNCLDQIRTCIKIYGALHERRYGPDSFKYTQTTNHFTNYNK